MKRQLNRLLFTLGFLAVILGVSFGLRYLLEIKSQAQTSLPASKAALQVGNLNVMSGVLSGASKETPWQTVMKSSMKTSQQKDMIITASMEVGLYTGTLVSSKNGVSDTSSATAGIEVRMVVDGGTPNERIAEPGEVILGRRSQTLTATFQGLIDGCLTVDPTTGGIIIDPLCVQPETLELILDTMNASTFVFALDDLGSGVHKVEMQARMVLNTSVQTGSATARAIMGKGSCTVEEVRLVKGADITL